MFVVMSLSMEHVTHLHGSIEASHRRVDEPSDNSVQDEGENLQRRKRKKKKLSTRIDHTTGLSSV